jgi:hypothetical protein
MKQAGRCYGTRRFTAGALGLVALLASHGSGANAEPETFTSAIDVTTAKLQLRLAAPDRNSQKLIDITLPAALAASVLNKPKVAALFATPLGTLMDQYWNTKDPKTGTVPRLAVCDGMPGQEGIKQTVAEKVKEIGSGYSAYDIVCTMTSKGEVLVKRHSDAAMDIAYQLTRNTVRFRVRSPFTCDPKHDKQLCLNDARITMTFALQVVMPLRSPSLCHISADGATAHVVGVSIEGDNAAGDIARFFKADKFIGAEAKITSQVKQVPLPIDEALAELRNSAECTGKTPGVSRALTAFRRLETDIDLRNRAVILRAEHVGIEAPKLTAPNPGGPPTAPGGTPSFVHPQITTSLPTVKAGATVQVQGEDFPLNINLATALPVTIHHGGYGEHSIILGGLCFGGATEMEWGPAGRPRLQRLPGEAQGQCPPHFEATGLTANTQYHFRARDCDPITCSPWSAPVQVTTARSGGGSSAVAISLDNGTGLGATNVDGKGKFATSVTIPASTPAGAHTITAVNGNAKATAQIQVVAAGTVMKPTIAMLGTKAGQTDCSSSPIAGGQVEDTVMMLGSGFAPGTVAVRLDSVTGFMMGSATVDAGGSFCQRMNTPPSSLAGKHNIVAVENGAIAASVSATFILPEVVH